MIGRPKVPLVLTTPEQQALDSLAHRARTAPQVARRARIVLACARGLDNQTVAKKLRVSPQMVGRWRARFVTRRVDGLLDAPRPGAPRTITDDTVEGRDRPHLGDDPASQGSASTTILPPRMLATPRTSLRRSG